MIPPPPRPPLFPYTTLFRSLEPFERFLPDRNPLPERPRRRHLRLVQSDRKSTRLNSSHLVISYAVFCLKKKTKKKTKFIDHSKYCMTALMQHISLTYEISLN